MFTVDNLNIITDNDDNVNYPAKFWEHHQWLCPAACKLLLLGLTGK
jgi:hypothetical protein